MPVTPQLTFAQKKLLKKLRGVVNGVAAELGVEPALLAAKRDLEQLVLVGSKGKLPERMKGWRQAVITDRLLEALEEQ